MDTLWVGRIYLAACHSKQRMFIRSSKCWPASLILRAKLAHTAHQLMYIFACPLSRLSRLVARRLPIVCVSASKRCPAVVRAFTFCSLDAMSKVEEEVAAAPAAPTTSADAPNHASWQQTMLRVKDPEVEVPFWQYVSVVSTDCSALSCGTVVLMTSRKMLGCRTNFGFELVARLDFPQVCARCRGTHGIAARSRRHACGLLMLWFVDGGHAVEVLLVLHGHRA